VTILLIYAALLLVALLVWLIGAIIYVTKAKKDSEDNRTEIDSRH
jgi:hypothetical protein